MDLMLLRLFQAQVRFQSQAVLSAAEHLEAALQAEDTTEVWIAAQNLLAAAANVAKALWGSGGKSATKRAPLRKSLGITDSSPLKNVLMRNHLEHYDERLDKWWKESASHNHVDMSVMPPSAVAGIDVKDMFRVLDPTTLDAVFWGERFNLRDVVHEIERLLPVVSKEAAKPHWQP